MLCQDYDQLKTVFQRRDLVMAQLQVSFSSSPSYDATVLMTLPSSLILPSLIRSPIFISIQNTASYSLLHRQALSFGPVSCHCTFIFTFIFVSFWGEGEC